PCSKSSSEPRPLSRRQASKVVGSIPVGMLWRRPVTAKPAARSIRPEALRAGSPPLRQVEDEHFRWRARPQSDLGLIRDRRSVAFLERLLPELELALHDLHPSVTVRSKRVRHLVVRVEAGHVEHDILMDRERAVSRIAGREQDELAAALVDREAPLLVARREPARLGADPDLDEPQRLRLRWVELAVRDARA